MLILGLNKTIDRLAVPGSVRWHGHGLRMEEGLALTEALGFEGDGQQ